MKVCEKDLEKVCEFQKEKDKFYLLSLIATDVNSLLYSDLENYIVGRSEIGYPTWIWTKNGISSDKYMELKFVLEEFLVNGKNEFTCKRELYDLLSRDYPSSDFFEMGFLTCHKLIKPKFLSGIFVLPNYADKVTLAEYFREYDKEIFDRNTKSQREALEEVEVFLREKRIYVLKNSSLEIVSMAGFSTLNDLAKITYVYTPKEERRKGYCQSLIYQLSKKLMDDGYLPLLYTDYHYLASNRAYQSVGYEEKGVLINFVIER